MARVRSSKREKFSDFVCGVILGKHKKRSPHRRRGRKIPKPPQRRFRDPPHVSSQTRSAMVLEAEVIRKAQRAGIELRKPIERKEIFRLAELEGVAINFPGRQPPFAEGLRVRLAKRLECYWFLGSNCYYYKSSDRHGNSPDLDFVPETYVPLAIKILAYPYRQLCHCKLEKPSE
ncbi:hypothetical protein F5Y04DRAFT_282204 [Hypomontagnella monticulosa]|nr:hypothetical protein F5Y04DRAFT_282204 [Hypomontagnella monticulosa]